MSKDLEARRQVAESEYEKLRQEKEIKEQEVVNINTELVRLEGDYRILTELIGQVEPIVSPEANVIDVDAAVNKKGKKK